MISMSIAPTCTCSSAARAKDRAAANVDLPTPPLPLKTRILCLMVAKRAWRSGRSGSGPLGREAQMVWLGHPSQLSASPLTNQPNNSIGERNIRLIGFCAHTVLVGVYWDIRLDLRLCNSWRKHLDSHLVLAGGIRDQALGRCSEFPPIRP